jgi:hemoglobin
MPSTLFNKYGGIETFSAIVSNFYKKVLDSEQLEHYFRDIKIDRLISHQTHFLAKALGGPDKYDGKDLAIVHANMNISAEDFDEVVELLEEAGVETADISNILSLIAGLKAQIVTV